MPKTLDVLTSHPKILDLVMKAATTAAGIAAVSKGGASNGGLSDIIAKAVSATVTSASVAGAAADASEAVNTIPEKATKSVFASSGMQGSALATLSGLATLFSLWQAKNFEPSLWVPAITAVAGGLYAGYGRLKAKTRVG